jgi:hypothetical protein
MTPNGAAGAGFSAMPPLTTKAGHECPLPEKDWARLVTELAPDGSPLTEVHKCGCGYRFKVVRQWKPKRLFNLSGRYPFTLGKA